MREDDMVFHSHGVKSHCVLRGEGKPLLVLHGHGGEGNSFYPVAMHYAPRRSVYAVDFPGYGQSAEPPEPWSITEYTAWLAAWMRDIGLSGCDIIAHSFGGRVAILLAATYPELVGKLVLTGAAGLIPKRSMKYYLKVWSYKTMKRMAKWTFLARAFRLEERIKRRAGSSDYRALSESMKKTFVRVVNQDLRPFLPSIKASTLLIWGAKDDSAPLWFGQVMEKEIPDAGLVVFENAGHFAYLEELHRFLAITDHFLEG